MRKYRNLIGLYVYAILDERVTVTWLGVRISSVLAGRYSDLV